MSFYSRSGDTGFTSTRTRTMIPKNSPVFSLLGALEELDSALEVARYRLPGQIGGIVSSVRKDVASFSTQLSGGPRFAGREKVEEMERSIDAIMDSLPEGREKSFGGSEGGAYLDLAWAVARRAERELVGCKQAGGVGRDSQMFANRLSDLIYALARLADASAAPPAAGRIGAVPEDTAPPQNAMPAGGLLQKGLWLCREVMRKAESMSLPVVTSVCDSGANRVVTLRADGAYIASVDIAENKAYTSMSLKMSTEELGGLSGPGGPLYGVQNTNGGRIVVFGGGLPLYENGSLVGGFGVSGGSAEQDISLAHYADRIFNNSFH